MSIADIVITITTWIFQKMILPIYPVDLPFLSFFAFNATLQGSMKHNFIWSLAGLNQLFNLNLLFILIMSMITAEIVFWLARAGIFMVKLIRG